MARLRDLAKLIRSKNAGPFELTIDFIFEDEPTYLRVKNSDIINRKLIAATYRVDESDVRLFHHDQAFAIKATVPRFAVSGNPDDSDVFGGQQHAPFLDLEVPEGNVISAARRV